nr:MAG TPA: hypothetical protein [Caudoviricetes sp.]
MFLRCLPLIRLLSLSLSGNYPFLQYTRYPAYFLTLNHLLF